jgi:putative nucleotidyltransferase with HDIG domain
MPDREEAWELLCEWTQSEALRKHALGVEAAMRAMARRMGGDEEAWGLCGLLHDFDYERHPQIPDHPLKGADVLRSAGVPEDTVLAILGHATFTGVPRETPMAKALFAVDELTGFLFACAFVQPDRKVASVRPESARKKLKDKSFARGVNREDIRVGAEEIGMEVDTLILLVRDALAENAETLGL